MKIFKYLFPVVIGVALFSCQFLDPEEDGHNTNERLTTDPSFAEGFLMRGYLAMPTYNYRYDETGTDDAVSNSTNDGFRRMAIGEWSAANNAQDVWTNCYDGIMYINKFLEVVDIVPHRPSDPNIDKIFKLRLRGEAYAMRGILKYYLLLHHAGVSTDGQLLGTPIYDEFLEDSEGFTKPRASFVDGVNSVYSDLDKALNSLPFDFGNIADINDMPASYRSLTNDIEEYNFVCGIYTRQRVSGRIAQAFKARMALLHASPAYNEGNNSLWEKAAESAALLLDDLGGVSQMEPKGHEFFLGPQVSQCDVAAAGGGYDFPEFIWRKMREPVRGKEQEHFPPSIYGRGRMNPTQNLVDAFPMANGYPIGHANSNYDPSDPYADRDPRMDLYIVRNGGTLKGTMWTEVGNTDDGLNATINSTRTGYYMKKLIRGDVNVGPGSEFLNQEHVDVFVRYTEMFLAYAEAANEAWGPEGDPAKAYSPRDIIGAIRARAGIEAPDPYLASITTKEDMRTLIQNERRLELCFEGFRFWDLRRWNANMNEPARGVRIENGTYTYFDVEPRAYQDYMRYGPIPRTEVVKFQLTQNRGW